MFEGAINQLLAQYAAEHNVHLAGKDASHIRSIFDPGQELPRDMNNLRDLINSALLDLSIDTPLFGTTTNSSSASR